MDPFEYQGYWWLPENPENRHSGTLSFSHQEGLRLETLGSFSLDALEPGESMTISIGDMKHFPVIKGVVRGSGSFTLFECDSVGPSMEGIIPTEQFNVRYAIEEELPNPKKIPPNVFNKARMQFTYLADWVGTSDIRREIIINDAAKKIERLKISYEVQDSIVAELERAKISMVEGYKSSGANGDVRGISLTPHFSLEIEVDEALSFNVWLYKFIGPLGDFLTLAVRRPNAVTKLVLYSNESQTEVLDGIRKPAPMTIYYSQGIQPKPNLSKTIDAYHMLFGFQDVKEEIVQILQTWLSKRNEFESMMDLFFAVENSSETYLDNEFLNLAQALEVYHRKRFDNLVSPKSDFKAKKKAILERVPEEHQEWLTEQLAYANQPKLHQRLIELLGHTQRVTSKLGLNTNLFARKVTDTRNFLTHFSRKPESVMEGEELFRATQVLSYMIQACIMLELGLSDERVVSLFERNQKFLFTALQIKQAHYWE